MSTSNISRRMLIKAGLSSALLAAIPLKGLSFEFSNKELEIIGNVDANLPYKSESTGILTDNDVDLLKGFSQWVISSWEFSDMGSYTGSLSGVLQMKTSEKPSWLEEYKSASLLIRDAKGRFNSQDEMYLHLLFSGREDENNENTRIKRAQRFVFDEIVRHIISNGGFRRFGLVNYKGYFGGGSFYNAKSYRRDAI